jgi:hypothetical protein
MPGEDHSAATDFKAISDSDFRQGRLDSLVQEIIFISDETIGAPIPPFCCRTPKSDRYLLPEALSPCKGWTIQ